MLPLFTSSPDDDDDEDGDDGGGGGPGQVGPLTQNQVDQGAQLRGEIERYSINYRSVNRPFTVSGHVSNIYN